MGSVFPERITDREHFRLLIDLICCGCVGVRTSVKTDAACARVCAYMFQNAKAAEGL